MTSCQLVIWCPLWASRTENSPTHFGPLPLKQPPQPPAILDLDLTWPLFPAPVFHLPHELCNFTLISSCSSSNSLAALVGSLSHQSRLFLHPLLKPLKCHCSLLFKLNPFCNPYLIYTNIYIHPVLCGVWYELILVIKMELAVASARLPRQVDFKTHHCYWNGQYSWISC